MTKRVSIDDERDLRQRLIGNYLKKSREDSSLTQRQVADSLAYTSPQFISNWERGMALPPLDLLPRLAELYQLPPRQFLVLLQKYQEELLKLQKRQLVELFRDSFPKAF